MKFFDINELLPEPDVEQIVVFGEYSRELAANICQTSIRGKANVDPYSPNTSPTDIRPALPTHQRIGGHITQCFTWCINSGEPG